MHETAERPRWPSGQGESGWMPRQPAACARVRGGGVVQYEPFAKRAIGSSLDCVGAGDAAPAVEARMIWTGA
ncbi:hypothetical protein C7399_112198 [Paraburkholderia tropica]|uniref:Uncharacterized protein n=1 Tax=Paraburkholderia tropica TaxID=92647 RepID=A0AAQ1JUZ4_9BURK|nr:hypothetical protein C7400_112199 [Paraburkholderia tropica]PZW79651.1 hypothetical protein C7399_112198 [Paraburkholderia tropica]SEJ85238.1 hypothetical protein SAMN05216550_109215 [Paraburkholderia tropica]